MKKNSRKNNRLNEEVMRALSEIIRMELKDPRIHPMTSISAVEVAPDLKSCKVYISVLGDDAVLTETVEGLKSAAGFVRKCLARTLDLRNTPEIRFLADHSIAYGIAMGQKIDAVIGQDAHAQTGETE